MVVGGRDRERLGALCPSVRLVPGARGDTTGDRGPPAPVSQRASISLLPRPRPHFSRWHCGGSHVPTHAETVAIHAPPPPQLAAVNLPAAGIDIGAAAHGVAVPPRDDAQPVRGFGALTAALEALGAWLGAWAITTVALEATGVSWSPLLALLEARGFAVLLVDPPQVQQTQGRPTSDGHDGQGSQRLPPCGRLSSAFRPSAQVCVLRSDLRQRARLLT
jgi:transposase